MKTTRTHLVLTLKGAAMGIAETIPGVSGGTIAFITGIYERLLQSIGSFGPVAWQAWRTAGFRGLWAAIDGNFLLFLFGGMGLGILAGIFGMSYLLTTFPLQVWGFFFGLIVASAWFVGREVSHWNKATIVALVLGTVVA
ncbi:MAG: DUF368 domain-containing protein, partial [Bacteroidetes bacterium]